MWYQIKYFSVCIRIEFIFLLLDDLSAYLVPFAIIILDNTVDSIYLSKLSARCDGRA